MLAKLNIWSFALLPALLCCGIATSLKAQDLTQIYCSGLNPDQSVDVLINSSASGEFFWLDAANTIHTGISAGYWDAAGWQYGTLAAPQHPWLGFRRGGSEPLANPIYFPEAGGNIVHTRFSPLETDPLGDHAVGESYLDILETRIAFSESKLYFTIKNNDSSFPVSSGITFFSYMGILVDPDASVPDPIVFGLMYTVDVAGIIAPGLYKITGTATSDLILLGEIETSIDAPNGTLTMSCDLADLTNDPDFSAWFDPNYPRIGTAAMTSRISLTGGNVTSDTTAGIDVLLKPQLITLANAAAPQITDPHVVWNESVLSLTVTYSDADQNIAQNCQFRIDGGSALPLFPANFTGFAQPVDYVSQPVPVSGTWNTLQVSVVNAGQVYTFDFNNTATSDEAAPSLPALEIQPNPARNVLYYNIREHKAGMKLGIFNLRGQLLLEQLPPLRAGQIDLGDFPAGKYLLRYGSAQLWFTKK